MTVANQIQIPALDTTASPPITATPVTPVALYPAHHLAPAIVVAGPTVSTGPKTKSALGGQLSSPPHLKTFHKFLTHGTTYVKYGYVEHRRQVMVLSEFLTGKAYSFYTHSVSLDPE
ncbi:hypothetical protein C0995_010631 [Termitomyces sp. Mi166|nr:hypothetical protein C0995_010631 [Termitomyces sp. Mi166\